MYDIAKQQQKASVPLFYASIPSEPVYYLDDLPDAAIHRPLQPMMMEDELSAVVPQGVPKAAVK